METGEESPKRVASEAYVSRRPQTARLRRFLLQHCTTPAPPDANKLREAPEGVGSEAKGPAGPPEGAVFEELFGRAKSSPPEAKCPEGKKARAAGPKRATPGGRRETFQKTARAAGPKKTFSVK